MMVRIITGLIVRSGARQVHPKGPGPVSSLLDTGSLTGGEYQYHTKYGGKAPPTKLVAEEPVLPGLNHRLTLVAKEPFRTDLCAEICQG